MFEELLKQWANEQGFQTWSQDHAAVLRNLAKWLNMHAAKQSAQPTPPTACEFCGHVQSKTNDGLRNLANTAGN